MMTRLPVLSAFALVLAAQTHVETSSPAGREFSSLPDDKGAVAAAEKAAAADPKNPAVLLKLAQAQAGIWQNREAAETYTRLLAIDSANSSYLTERGHRELPLREFKKAQADLKKAAELGSKNPDTYYHLGLSHYFEGEFNDAADAFHRAVELAPNTDSRINSTNWWYASLRRAGKTEAAAKALGSIPPEMKNTEPHTFFYLSLLRFFQGAMKEAEAVPAEPPAGNTDHETELRFDTVAYGVGNWYLYNNDPARAKEYFARILKGHVWITWGFVGAETELSRLK